MAVTIIHVVLASNPVEVELPTGAVVRGCVGEDDPVLFVEVDSEAEGTEARTFEVYGASEAHHADATVYVGSAFEPYTDQYIHIYELVAAP